MRLSTQDYCDERWKDVESYIYGVETGEIVVGQYIKRAIARYKAMIKMEDRFVYRVEKVDKIFKFFSFLNIDLRDKYVQFPLKPWQSFVLAFIFGFYFKDNTDKRVIREVLLFIGRKQGKTAFSAALQIYGMLFDNVSVPQSILLSNVAKQASVALNFAKNMITHTPELQERLIGQRNRIVFLDRDHQGFCETFSSLEPARLEAFSPSMAILDEIHHWDNNAAYQAIKTGTGARLNPLIMIITTAGSKMNGFCQEYLQKHKDILDDKMEDFSSLGIIYQPDPEDDLADPACWVKANPSLGLITTLEDLQISYNQSKHSIADQFYFITKHLNIFYDTPEVWIPSEFVIKNFDSNMDFEKLKGRDAFIGMDLSKNTDISSIVLYIPVEEEGINYVIPYFWIANMEQNMIRKNGKDLSEWIFDKYITKCQTKTIDLDLIFDKIIELSKEFNIISIQYDPFNAPVLVAKLKEALGQDVCQLFRQTAMQFNASMKLLEEMIYSTKIRFKNPVLTYHFSNVVLYIDQNANIKITKNKQKDSVDGVVSLAMAIGGWIRYKYNDESMNLNSYLDSIRS